MISRSIPTSPILLKYQKRRMQKKLLRTELCALQANSLWERGYTCPKYPLPKNPDPAYDLPASSNTLSANISAEISYPDFFFEFCHRALQLLLGLRFVFGEGVKVDFEVVNLTLKDGVFLRQSVAQLSQVVLGTRQLLDLNLHPLQLIIHPLHFRLSIVLPSHTSEAVQSRILDHIMALYLNKNYYQNTLITVKTVSYISVCVNTVLIRFL